MNRHLPVLSTGQPAHTLSSPTPSGAPSRDASFVPGDLAAFTVESAYGVSADARDDLDDDAVGPGLDRTPVRGGSKLEQRMLKRVGQAVRDWNLLEEGDRVMVCMSGGKDSYALLDMLLLLSRYAPVNFEIFALNIDQGWPDYDTARISSHLERRGVEYYMTNATIAEIVEAKLAPGATPCSLCSRLRRGALYGFAEQHRATKIALGHHLDDLAETLLLNLFYSGQLKAMPARLQADDGRNVVIRPLVYIEEQDTIAYALERRYPTVRCGCPTCGLPDQKRQVIKRMLASMSEENPGIKRQMLAALRNVRAGHLLDRGLLDALNAGRTDLDAGAGGGTVAPGEPRKQAETAS